MFSDSFKSSTRVMILLAAGAAVTACAPSDAAESVAADTATLAARPALVNGRSRPDSGVVADAALRFVVAPTGNQARYRVREQLVGRDLPNDAVGTTSGVTGSIAVDSAGAVIPTRSRFVVDVAALRSDRDRRDGYVRGRLLETDRFPTVDLVPTAVRGLPASLPTAAAASGPRTFEMLGDLTVRGVTRPTTWRVTAQYHGGQITGKASTGFTFEDFDLTQPRVPVVLSVADTIRLEYDFTLLPDTSAGP
jgi:polyisoprenoid-binding protein YceI